VRGSRWACIAAAAVLVFAGCGDDEEEPGAGASGGSGEEQEQEVSSVKVAKFLTAGIAGVPIAEEQGLFADNNLEVEQVDVELPNIIPSVISGDNQFGIASAGGILAAAVEGLPVKIVAPAYYANPAEQGVYVGKDSPIKSIEDLKGKQIATGTLGSVAHAGMLKAVQEAGMDPKDVEVISFTFPDIPAALRNGKLDSGHMSEPLITANADSVREIIDDIYPYGELPAVSYWFTSEQFASENPEAVEGFRTAVGEAQDLANSDEQVARDAVATITELEPAVVDKLNLPGFGSDPKKEQLTQQAEALNEFGFLDEVPDVNALFVEGA
jgi:NitT/TauT family transport system substrate-binding protein